MKFEYPELKVQMFEVEDVLTTSGPAACDDDFCWEDGGFCENEL